MKVFTVKATYPESTNALKNWLEKDSRIFNLIIKATKNPTYQVMVQDSKFKDLMGDLCDWHVPLDIKVNQPSR